MAVNAPLEAFAPRVLPPRGENLSAGEFYFSSAQNFWMRVQASFSALSDVA